MADVNSVVEEKVKFRDGKKWKARWCVLKKPSPVADCVHVQLYKSIKDAVKGESAKHDFYLEDFYGLETGFTYDKEVNVLAIICQKQITIFAFESRETLIKFEIKIRNAFGEDHQFPVTVKKVPPQSKMPLQRMRMHIHSQKFCLTSNYPPKLQAAWNISELRSFGIMENRFAFNGGSKSGKVSGLHVLESNHTDEIEEIVQLASQGKTVSSRKNKRRSQHCDYLDPVTRSSGSLYKGSLPNSPTMHISRQWRHSISVSNSAWSASQSSQLMSIENVERERLRSLYDVPPRRVREVERIKSIQDKSCQQRVEETPVTNNVDPSVNGSWSSIPETSSMCLGCTSTVSASAPALCGYGAYSPFSDEYKNISCSVPNHIDEMDREEALECLQREERDLQREISLLDEMLLGCESSRRGHSRKDKNNPPPIPRKHHKSSKRPGNIPIPNTASQIQKDYYPETLLSPNLFSRLKKIPSNSKLSAPLPYVNLEKYDIGDVDNSHVNMPVASGCVDSGNWSAPCLNAQRNHQYLHRSDGNKENVGQSPKQTKTSSHNKNFRGRCSSESELSYRSVSSCVSKEESNYMNDLPLRDRSPPPPALPPKGPNLLKKSQTEQVSLQDKPPPVPPHRRQLSSRPSARSEVIKRETSHHIPSDSYLMMADFQTEKKNDSIDSPRQTPEVKRTIEKRSPNIPTKTSPNSAYMEMGVIFESEEKFKERQQQKESVQTSPRFQYMRSLSTSCMQDSDKPTVEGQFHSVTSSNTSLVREENYLLMSNFKTADKSCESPVVHKKKLHTSIDLISQGSYDGMSQVGRSSNDIVDTEHPPPIAPFTNLMNFQQHSDSLGRTPKSPPVTSVSNTSSKTASASNINRPSVNSPSDKSSTSDGKTTGGFLTRLIRRNSGNRKSMSQSQENLLASSSSESCLDRSTYQSTKDTTLNHSVSQSSDSSSTSGNPTQQESEDALLAERKRSSSVPNRSSFLEMLNNDKENTAQQQSLHDSYFSALSLDDEMQLLESAQDLGGSDSSSLNDSFKGKPQSCYMGPCESTGSENGEDDHDCHLSKQKLNQYNMSPEKTVYTVLHARHSQHKDMHDSRKTDDEKLIELLKAGSKSYLQGKDDGAICDELKRDSKRRLSLPSDRSKRSPKEEALAIAKHVTSLPPFVPPKMKTYLSCSLSPVIESVQGNTDTGADRSPSVSCGAMYNKETPKRGCNPVQQKEFARATLRIKPMELEESENIWILRQQSTVKGDNSVSDKNETEEEKFQALVVEIEEECVHDDTISMSSLDSSVASCDESVRSSPASTLLRPRSGKEYKMVERRHTTNDSVNSSPVQTPQSPSGTSVFTFETSCSPSQVSVYSKEHESPSIPKISRSESTVSSRIYERISPTRMPLYMNIDMTPPSSPCYPLSLPPAEQLEPQLNYAEIDLSNTSNSRSSRKNRKMSMRSLKPSSTIEYAMIDMAATRAIKEANKQHAISREDSLHRPSRGLSLVSHSREHKSSVSEPCSPEPLPPRDSHTMSSPNQSGSDYTTSPERNIVEDTLLPERCGSTMSSSSSEVDIDTESDTGDEGDRHETDHY